MADFISGEIDVKRDGRLITSFKHDYKEHEIRCLKQSAVKRIIEKTNQVYGDEVIGLSSNSDLITGQYEGGFKVWESTKDLLDVITSDSSKVQGKNILDLGCGSGLIGISCLLLGAKSVTFHDYNHDVIQFFTLPNILLALKINDPIFDFEKLKTFLKDRVKLISGDWHDFQSKESFDLIVSSETIYNQNYYDSLTYVIQSSLGSSSDSCALIAAKTYYFGVGGGTRSFEDFVHNNTHLTSSVYQVIPESVQREVLQLKRVQK